MINRVILYGNLGRAPHFKKTQDGKDMATFSLATSCNWKGPDGEWNNHVDWHRVTVFKESTVRWMMDTLEKGDPVYVEGKLMYRKWTDKKGVTHKDANVVVSDRNSLVEHMRDANPKPINQNVPPLDEITIREK